MNELVIENNNKSNKTDKIKNKGSLLYVVEAAFIVLKVFGLNQVAENMKEEILKCDNEDAALLILEKYEKLLDDKQKTKADSENKNIRKYEIWRGAK